VGFVYIADGSFEFSVESDGISAVNEIYVAGGNINVTKSYEGLEARLINIISGVINITSDDDGLNATDKRSTATSGDEKPEMPEGMDKGQAPEMPDGQEQGEAPEMPDGQGQGEAPQMPEGMDKGQATDNNGEFGGGKMGGGFGGGDPMGDTQEDANINISGGIVYINAEGDGVDSNGYFTMSGGELYITGPSNGGNGALDYGIDATITGGIVVAAGQSGMAVNFGSDSTQGSMLVNTSSQNEAGTQIVLKDSDGNKIIEWTMEKQYNSVVISCPEIVDGGTYTVEMGDSSTEVTMDGLIYGDGFSGSMRGDRDMNGDNDKNGNHDMKDDHDKNSDHDKNDDHDMKQPDKDNGGKDETTTGGGREISIEGNSDNT
jgi:hypothetical protein